MNVSLLTNRPDVATWSITKFRCIRKVMKTSWCNFTKISRFEAPLHMQLFNLLQLHFLLVPPLLYIIASFNIPLHILFIKALKNPSSFQYKSYRKFGLVIDWADCWQHQSNFFHPILFWKWMHHLQFPSKFPVLSHLEAYLIDLDPWLTKATPCFLKWNW